MSGKSKPARNAESTAKLKMTSSNHSPGGSRIIDFRLGGIMQHNDADQAAMLDDMLAEAEAEDEERMARRESPHDVRSQGKKTARAEERGSGTSTRRVMDMKPSELAAKYGVEATESDSENDDFGPDSPIQQKEAKAEAKDGSSATPADFDWSQAAPAMELAQRNMELAAELDQRKVQVRKLGVMLEALAPVPGLDAERLLDVMEGQDVEPVDARDVKIVHLAKKSRNLKLDNDRLKQKAADAEKRAREKEAEAEQLRRQIETMASPEARAVIMKQLAGGSAATKHNDAFTGKENASSSSSSSSSSTTTFGPEASTALRRKDKELLDARRRVNRTLDESKKLKSALQRELGLAPGEDIPRRILHPEAAAEAGEKPFKGRAETIVLLRSKCKRLEADLEKATGRKDPLRAARGGEHRDVDRQAAEDLQHMEVARRAAMEQLTDDYQTLSGQYGQATKKLEAAKARGAVLENDNAKFRKQMRVLLSKGDDDDALVEELRSELQALRVELHDTKQKLEAQMSGRAYGATRTMVAGTQIVAGSLPKQRINSTPLSSGSHSRGSISSALSSQHQNHHQQQPVGGFKGFGVVDDDEVAEGDDDWGNYSRDGGEDAASTRSSSSRGARIRNH